MRCEGEGSRVQPEAVRVQQANSDDGEYEHGGESQRLAILPRKPLLQDHFYQTSHQHGSEQGEGDDVAAVPVGPDHEHRGNQHERSPRDRGPRERQQQQRESELSEGLGAEDGPGEEVDENCGPEPHHGQPPGAAEAEEDEQQHGEAAGREPGVEQAKHLDAAHHAMEVVAAGEFLAEGVGLVHGQLRERVELRERDAAIPPRAERFAVGDRSILDHPLPVADVPPDVGVPKVDVRDEHEDHAEQSDGQDVRRPEVERGQRRVGIAEIDPGSHGDRFLDRGRGKTVVALLSHFHSFPSGEGRRGGTGFQPVHQQIESSGWKPEPPRTGWKPVPPRFSCVSFNLTGRSHPVAAFPPVRGNSSRIVGGKGDKTCPGVANGLSRRTRIATTGTSSLV